MLLEVSPPADVEVARDRHRDQFVVDGGDVGQRRDGAAVLDDDGVAPQGLAALQVENVEVQRRSRTSVSVAELVTGLWCAQKLCTVARTLPTAPPWYVYCVPSCS